MIDGWEARLVLVVPRLTRDTGGGFCTAPYNSASAWSERAPGNLSDPIPNSLHSHHRSFHHPVSLSLLTVFVPASSSISHQPLEGLVESKPICGCCFLEPLRTPAQADVRLDAVCSVPGPSRHILSSSPSPETFAQIEELPNCSPGLCKFALHTAPTDNNSSIAQSPIKSSVSFRPGVNYKR